MLVKMEEFYTIKETVVAEIVEKKSKFIATAFNVKSKDEADMYIKQTKKKYHDARHNCIAYRIIEDGKLIEKSSDDGEPSGTAGAPMLDIIRNKKLCNILIIVTRYFGGVLLGTGGLVRAYTEATLKVIEDSKILCQSEGWNADIELEYKDIENFKYYCKNNDINIKNIEYLDYIICKIEFENKRKEKLFIDIDKKNIKIKQINNLCKNYINKSVEK